MMRFNKINFLLLVFLLLHYIYVDSKTTQQGDFTNHTWDAYWISYPEHCNEKLNVYLFRKKLQLESKPSSFRVLISADTKFRLYINNKFIGQGPQPSDIHHWNYKTLDISANLVKGNNIICVEVFSDDKVNTCFPIGVRPGLIIQGVGDAGKAINTNDSWKVTKSKAYSSINTDSVNCPKIFEKFDGTKHEWNWKTVDFNDNPWLQANQVEKGKPTGTVPATWNLQPEPTEDVSYKKSFIPRLIRHSNPEMVDTGFLFGSRPFVVPKNVHYKILIDNDSLAYGYPVLVTRFGKQARIRIRYSDALADSSGIKGNRNEHKGKNFSGPYDEFITDGGEFRQYVPFTPRFFRFIELDIKTHDHELEISEFYAKSPSENPKQRPVFHSQDETLDKIWRICRYSNKLCSQEIFISSNMGAPVQTMGSAMMQAEINAFLTGDISAWKNSLLQFRNSLVPEGLVQSVAPTEAYLPDPVASLFWIYSLYYYYMYTGNLTDLKTYVPTVQSILFWFEQLLNNKDLLLMHNWKPVPDDIPYFQQINIAHRDQCPLLLNLMYVYALQLSAEIFEKLDYRGESSQQLYLAQKIQKAVNKNHYNKTNRYYSEFPKEDTYTQHSNAFAVLTGTVMPEKKEALMDSVLHGDVLTKTSLHFSYFTFKALLKTDLQAQFLQELYPWHNMVLDGLSTTCENYTYKSEGAECYPANAHPSIYMIKILCGFMPKEPGYEKVLISPQLSDLKSIEARFYIAKGRVDYAARIDPVTNKMYASIVLPKGVSGYLKWEGKLISLSPGANKIEK